TATGTGTCPRRGRTLGGNRENRELRCKLLAVALGASGFLAAINDGFKFVVAFFTNVFVNGHESLRQSHIIVRPSGGYYTKQNQRICPPSRPAWRPYANCGVISPAPPFQTA